MSTQEASTTLQSEEMTATTDFKDPEPTTRNIPADRWERTTYKTINDSTEELKRLVAELPKLEQAQETENATVTLIAIVLVCCFVWLMPLFMAGLITGACVINSIKCGTRKRALIYLLRAATTAGIGYAAVYRWDIPLANAVFSAGLGALIGITTEGI